MKKRISLILILTLCVLCLSSCALLTGERRSGFYKYTVENGEVTITGYSGLSTDLTIPDSIAGMPVVAIGESAFYEHRTIQSVTIPDSVVRIDGGAFSKCSVLERVVLGQGVREVDYNPFYDCNKLSYNEYENGFYLGNENNPYFVFVSTASEDVETITFHPNAVIVCGSAFQLCESLRHVTFPEGIISIGSFAMRGCSALETVYIPKTVESIGQDVFVSCEALQEIVLSEENGHFKLVEGSLFSHDGTQLIKYATWQTTELYKIPDGTVIIASSAFENAKYLKEVVIPNSVEELDDDAFHQCENLSSIHFGNGLKRIGYSAFGHCDKLESVVIVSSVKELDAMAFYGCDMLREVVFEDPTGWSGSNLHTLIPVKKGFSDPEKNAEYLTEYNNLYWSKQ